jgi:hypothetical protein
MSDESKSTLSALLKDKPRRGRPKHAVSRQNVYVELSDEQKSLMRELAKKLPKPVRRADIPDLATALLSARLEQLRRSVEGRNREMPEGIVELISLYLLWDLPVPRDVSGAKWTSIRLSPQQVVQLGRVHGVLNALFGASRSQVFSLGIALLEAALENELATLTKIATVQEMKERIIKVYL